MGWSNQLPNPLVVGGLGQSGEIDVYNAAGVLIAVINADGITVYNPARTKSLTLAPEDSSGLPAVQYVTPLTPAGDFGEITGDDNTDIAGTALIMSSTDYANTFTGFTCRAVNQIAANRTYLAIRRNFDLLYDGGYCEVTDTDSRLGYQTSGTTWTSVQCDFNAVTIVGDVQRGGISQARGFVTGAWATTNSAAVGTSDVVTHTASSATFKTGRVYALHLAGRMGGESGGATTMAVHFRKGTTTAGALVIDFGFVPGLTSKILAGQALFANNTGSDITTQTCMSIVANVGTAQWLGSANSPSGYWIEDVGAVADFNNKAPMAFIT